MAKIKKNGIVYSLLIAAVFTAASLPIFVNIIVDPYEINNFINLDIKKLKISEKAHNPLWKISHYNPQEVDLIILGDSRTKSLRNKYWKELGAKTAYNFSYSGGTIFEIYDSFQFIKSNPNLKTLVIGVQLRSFDEKFKKGINRVPEAIHLYENPIAYNSNWFVSQVALELIKDSYFKNMQFNITDQLFVSKAHAISFFNKPKSDDQKPTKSGICNDCELPQDVSPRLYPSYLKNYRHYFGNNLGIWGELWEQSIPDNKLNRNFMKQVARNGAADWRYFEFSEKLWKYIEEISIWCRQNNIELILITPPTIVELQNRANDYELGKLNHILHLRLAELGTFVDFDYVNQLTKQPKHFTDAYHFNSDIAKEIIGEILRLIQPDQTQVANKNSNDIIRCPITEKNIRHKVTDGTTTVLVGKSCRIWRTKKND